MSFAKRLEILMKNHGTTKFKLSKQLNVSPSTITNWVNEDSKPNIEHIRALSALFHVTSDFLLTGNNAVSEETTAFVKMERALLSSFRKVDTEHKALILRYAAGLANDHAIDEMINELSNEQGYSVLAESGVPHSAPQLSDEEIRRIKLLLERYERELK